MIDTIPVRHKRSNPNQGLHANQHTRIHSSPDQVFVTPPAQTSNPPKWQIFQKQTQGKQLFEHTNKSDDSLELMPTIAMGYENSLNKKLQRRGELRITGDGYFFDQGPEEAPQYDNRGYRYNTDPRYQGYSPNQYLNPGSPGREYEQYERYNNRAPITSVRDYERHKYDVSGGVQRKVSSEKLEQDSRPRIHPVYDDRTDEDWANGRGSMNSSRSYHDLKQRYEEDMRRGVALGPYEQDEYRRLRPPTAREKSYERSISVERGKIRTISSERPRTPTGEDERLMNQNGDYFDQMPIIPQDIPQDIPQEPSIPIQQPQQQQQQQIIRSGKKKGFLKKMFTNDGKKKKYRKGNQVEISSGSSIPRMEIDQPSIESIQDIDSLNRVDQDQQQQPIEPEIQFTSIINNFPIISNIFQKIDDSGLPNNSKFLIKAMLLFWIFYEINSIFEIIGEWFNIFGSLFRTNNDELI